MFYSQEPLQNQLQVLETGFNPQQLEELLSFLDSTASPTSFSQESNRTSNSSSNLTDDSSNRTHDSNTDESRKQKRKLSNRDSARRSRWRKKQHLEDLTEQFNRFTVENQELKNHISLIMNRFYFLSRQNQCLRSECIALVARLSDLSS